MEEDVVAATVRNAFAQGCERVYLVDNESPDRTVVEAQRAGATLGHSYRTSVYDEALRLRLMNDLVAEVSKADGCAHIWWLFLDADEFPHGPFGMTLRDYLSTLDRVFRIVGARFFDHYPSDSGGYTSGRHPLDFQPLCEEMPFPMCPRMHRKHPLQRFDKNAPAITCGPGFHQADCDEPLIEPSLPIFLHHFPFRQEAQTRRRLESLWAKNEQGVSRADETKSHSAHMLARAQSLDAVYQGDWAHVRNFAATDPLWVKLGCTPPPAMGVAPRPWKNAVAVEHQEFARWYGPTDASA
jgi:hypothetical protein